MLWSATENVSDVADLLKAICIMTVKVPMNSTSEVIAVTCALTWTFFIFRIAAFSDETLVFFGATVLRNKEGI
jgi:hypothetical protein